jgi:hypothetical protein
LLGRRHAHKKTLGEPNCQSLTEAHGNARDAESPQDPNDSRRRRERLGSTNRQFRYNRRLKAMIAAARLRGRRWRFAEWDHDKRRVAVKPRSFFY